MTEFEMKPKKPVQTKVHCDRAKADQHRQVPFVQRVEGGRENFDRGISDESDRVKAKRFRRVRGCIGREPAVLIDKSR